MDEVHGASLTAGQSVEQRLGELRTPEAAVVPAGAKPEQMREPERGEVRGECEREGRVAEVVRHAAGDEEPRPERAEERGLALGEERGIVGGELGVRRVPKRS